MEINKIDEAAGANGTLAVRSGSVDRRCLYYKEEICRAPRCRFKLCQGCVRTNRQAAIGHLFERIKMMAQSYFMLEETELG
jgi:hypothetical protein